MKKTCHVLVLFLGAVLLASCGPIFGQMTKGGDGVKEFDVVQGSLATLRPGAKLLVYGPFAKTAEAYYICRGEEAAHFATAMAEAGLFGTDLYLEHTYNKVEKTAAALRGKSPEQLKAELELDILPDTILFGTLLRRDATVAPTRGVLMDITYRLEFYDVKSRQSTVLEMRVKHLAERCVPEVVAELKKKLAG